jgi:hypothetical protein
MHVAAACLVLTAALSFIICFFVANYPAAMPCPACLLLLPTCREAFFEKEISKIRGREVALMTKNAIIKTINIAMVFGTPPMTACVIFAAYEMAVGRLAATLAFTTLSLFNILRFPLVVLPKAMRALSEALASIARIEEFLLKEVPTDAEGATKASRPGTWIVSDTGFAAVVLYCCLLMCAAARLQRILPAPALMISIAAAASAAYHACFRVSMSASCRLQGPTLSCKPAQPAIPLPHSPT